MQSTASRILGGVRFVHARLMAAGFALALLAAGCTTDGTPGPTATSGVSAGRNATIAFESVDGPPVRLYQTFVSTLAEEATARRVQVVSRNGPAEYRIRIYLAAQVEGRRTRISWVWDVYDAERRRALRISGEDAGERKGADGWSAADDPMMRRMARASLDQLVAFLEQGPPPAVTEPPLGPDGDGTPVAAAPAPDALALVDQLR
jgi:hypothetical protein